LWNEQARLATIDGSVSTFVKPTYYRPKTLTEKSRDTAEEKRMCEGKKLGLRIKHS
jgi:hypothetical protein